MAISLELTPDLEQRLIEAAERNGTPLAAYLNRLLEAQLPTLRNGAVGENGRADRDDPAASGSLDAWETSLMEWIESHSRGLPLLSEEAIDRESIYGDAV